MTVPDPSNKMLDAALAFAAAGCSVVPAMANASKRPMGTWIRYQNERADEEQINLWYASGHPGVGLVCGQVSGGLLMLEAEGRAVGENLLARAREHAMAAGIGELWRTVMAGYLEQTPGGGVHLLYRIDGEVPGNQKLARRPGPPDEKTGAPTVEVLAETRGEGGYTIVAPSHGPVHPTGRSWTLLQGGPATIPTLTLAEHTALCSVFRALDEMPTEEEKWQHSGTSSSSTAASGSRAGVAPTVPTDAAAPAAGGTGSPDLRPGDDFEQRATWDEILTPHGWVYAYTKDNVRHWVRPGKNPREGTSATTGFGDRGEYFYVFSTSTDVPDNRGIGKFHTYVQLNFAGDTSAAAAELRRLGYGSPQTHLDPRDLLPSGSTTPAPPAAALAASVPAPVESPTLAPTVEQLAAQRRSQLEEHFYEKLVAEDAARKRYDAEILARDFRPPVMLSLTDELANPDEPVRYRVDRILPEEGNALITAGFKVGKTTLIGNLVRALADGGNFLGKFAVEPITEGRRVALFNYELSQKQYRVWLRQLGVQNTNAVYLFHMRGITLPLSQQWAEDFVVEHLIKNNVDVWVVDPFARAFNGSGEENSNTDVGAFVHILDRIKHRTGVSEIVMPAHTGRSGDAADRTRGAVRLNDWADVQWLMLKDDESVRYFSANGRDVDVEEEKLSYDEPTRTLRMGGGDRKWQARQALIARVVEVVTENPGIKSRELVAMVGGRKEYVDQARDQAIHQYRIKVETDGAAKLYFPTGRLFQEES